MNRVQFLMQGLDINEVQASLVSELIKDVPNENLKDFLVFRMRFIDQFKSKELITKEALFEYQKNKIENRLRNGEIVFSNIKDMQNYIETYYKGKELGYGLGHYKDFVIIALDRDCNLLNTYYAPNGNFYKLTSTEKQVVYNFLFENQHRIGDVKQIPFYEDDIKEIENKKVEEDENYISPKMIDFLKNKIQKG
jgi:hypothetical protein